MRLFQPLRHRPIALLWGGLALSGIGDQLFAVVLSWIAIGVFGAAAGYLVAFQNFAVLATALICGTLADRLTERTVMVAADLGRAVALVLTVLAWLAIGRPTAASLVLAVLALAVGQAFFRPALQTTLPVMSPSPAQLPATNALIDTTDRIARLLGPALIIPLAGFLPLPHFLSIDALTFLASAAAVRAALPRTGTVFRRNGRETMAASIRRGFTVMQPHPLLRFAFAISGVVMGTWYAAVFLGLPLAIEQLGIVGPASTGLGAFGLVIASYGSTNLLATLVIGNREIPHRPGGLIFGGTAIIGFGIMLLGFATLPAIPPPWRLPVLAACAALSAIGGPMEDIPLATLRQTLLAPSDIAAATRALLVVNYGGLLLAMLAAPGAVAIFGTAAVIAGCGGVMLACGVGGLVLHARTACGDTVEPA